MSEFLRMTLAVEFVMGELVTRVDDTEQADIIEDQNKSVTHIDYIHDKDIMKAKPGFVSKLQSTIEVFDPQLITSNEPFQYKTIFFALRIWIWRKSLVFLTSTSRTNSTALMNWTEQQTVRIKI